MAKLSKGNERSFQYQKRSKDDIKERANMRGSNFDRIFKPKYKQWKPKDGKNRIRILPPTWDKARHYGLDIFINYSKSNHPNFIQTHGMLLTERYPIYLLMLLALHYIVRFKYYTNTI